MRVWDFREFGFQASGHKASEFVRCRVVERGDWNMLLWYIRAILNLFLRKIARLGFTLRQYDLSEKSFQKREDRLTFARLYVAFVRPSKIVGLLNLLAFHR